MLLMPSGGSKLCLQTSSYAAQDRLPQQRIMWSKMSLVALLRSRDLVQLSLKYINLLLLGSNLLIFSLSFLELQLLS